MSDYWVRSNHTKMSNMKLGKYTPPPANCDPYWGDVAFLLTGDGPVNTNTVIDSGPLNLPFTTEWGTWTYVDNIVKYYPTSLIGSPTGALSTTILAGPANKSWTWEMWFYATSAALAGSGSGMSFLTNFDVSWAIMTRGANNGGNNELGLAGLFGQGWLAPSAPLIPDVWTYLTITFEDTTGIPGYPGTLRTFINGVLVNSVFCPNAPQTWDGQKVWIGPTANSFFTSNNYYFSDYRFTRGIARYTDTFTPPTTTLPIGPCP